MSERRLLREHFEQDSCIPVLIGGMLSTPDVSRCI